MFAKCKRYSRTGMAIRNDYIGVLELKAAQATEAGTDQLAVQPEAAPVVRTDSPTESRENRPAKLSRGPKRKQTQIQAAAASPVASPQGPQTHEQQHIASRLDPLEQAATSAFDPTLYYVPPAQAAYARILNQFSPSDQQLRSVLSALSQLVPPDVEPALLGFMSPPTVHGASMWQQAPHCSQQRLGDGDAGSECQPSWRVAEWSRSPYDGRSQGSKAHSGQ